jgi:hypothetical protein
LSVVPTPPPLQPPPLKSPPRKPPPDTPINANYGRQPSRPPPIGRSPPHLLPKVDKCTPNPCENAGTCIPVGTVDFICKCPPQYTGKLCTEPAKSYCHPSPCLNGGVCLENATGYKCQCVGHYRGTNCQGE